jgi:hypothetical protein
MFVLALWLLLEAADPVVLRHAPLLQRRANAVGTQSDIPLLMYAERLRDASGAPYLQYTVIFSNEDGGTSTRALMARWGRTTDIEHVYRVWLDGQGSRVKATIQTKDHADVPYAGPFRADRPILKVITDNNMVGPGDAAADAAEVELVVANLAGAARERIMDERPEMYRLAAEELAREGKLSLIGDPRHYLYLEAEIASERGAVAAWARLRGQDKWYSSHAGREKWAIERSGFVRTTIQLPPGATAADVAELGFMCLGEGACEVKQVTQAFFLDGSYRPQPGFLSRRFDRRLAAGEMFTWSLTSK